MTYTLAFIISFISLSVIKNKWKAFGVAAALYVAGHFIEILYTMPEGYTFNYITIPYTIGFAVGKLIIPFLITLVVQKYILPKSTLVTSFINKSTLKED